MIRQILVLTGQKNWGRENQTVSTMIQGVSSCVEESGELNPITDLGMSLARARDTVGEEDSQSIITNSQDTNNIIKTGGLVWALASVQHQHVHWWKIEHQEAMSALVHKSILPRIL
jgi:hypothetical protein